MIRLTPEQVSAVAAWYQVERVCWLVGSHVIHTGHGAVWADRWPAPRALLAEAAGQYALSGDPAALAPADLPPLAGFIEAPEPFVPLLRTACADLFDTPRVILSLPSAADLGAVRFAPAAAAVVRPLAAADEPHLAGLSAAADWVCHTWGGPAGLAASGRAWGAFVDGQLASVAGTFFAGAQYEELAVATEPDFRRQGLNTACAAALCRDIRARGRTPSWSTTTDNLPSRRVAEKLGFIQQRTDWLYITGMVIS